MASTVPPKDISFVDVGIDGLEDVKTPAPPAEKERELRSYDNIHLESRSILNLHEIFDGFNFTFCRGANSNLQLEHSISCAGAEPEAYNFTVMFGTANLFARGRVDTDGNVTGLGVLSSGPWKFCAQAQAVDDNPMLGITSAFSIDADYIGNDFNAGIKWAPLGLINLSYTQKISPSITAGVQGLYSHDQGMSLISGALRVDTTRTVCTAEVSSRETFEMSHLYKISKKLSVASEFKVGPNPRTGLWASSGAVGWQYTGTLANLKSIVTSDRRIASYYEEKFSPNVTLSFSGEINYPAKSYRVGFGLQLYV